MDEGVLGACSCESPPSFPRAVPIRDELDGGSGGLIDMGGPFSEQFLRAISPGVTLRHTR
jgi:hypothetical protein